MKIIVYPDLSSTHLRQNKLSSLFQAKKSPVQRSVEQGFDRYHTS
ncbi:hypothetical protein MAMP_01018 [Methylophaga aminisulfidivorans MP]|uniref:Uncharacterized protein n=1 Tax=Methylophaga aminisulfidivorans MP TaxID=1026882 RepID=F5SYP5_9GAMM|nr:hypothetical protein MAMP_01018 [Methylophaga aminisulfidivorans MP]